ncbi:MAG: putative toxin-antitoxin system toxin component, PIN family [Candidatus Poribacteria bacterium]|nr:putative toxin-antitoxin system toxin component, PIN family [Candidatus Poribacteria bacterium]
MKTELLPRQAVPDYVDWDKWMGPPPDKKHGLRFIGEDDSLFELFLESHDLFISDYLIKEIQDKLRNKIKLPKTTIAAIIELYTSRAIRLDPVELPPDAYRDPDDIPVLGTALAAEADFLITGDKDLLTLNTIEKVKIVTPREFYDTDSKD